MRAPSFAGTLKEGSGKNMRHPNEATLALHAGGDLGAIARWRVEHHLANCDHCREEVAAFTATREIVTGLGELPELPWAALAAEMKANIRLGLAAGECVRDNHVSPLGPWFTGMRAAVACTGIVALLAIGLFLERPQPYVVAQSKGIVVENTANGIQMSSGGQSVSLMNSGAENAIYLPSAQGNMGARYVDPKTGVMTVNTLYAQ
jgi:hypothetical protein